MAGRLVVCICSAGAGKCRSSRDAERRAREMLTSGKVPLEKTLMEKVKVSNRYYTAAS